MWFWKRSKKVEEEVGGARRRRTLHPADVKLLAVEARESGLGSREVAEMLGTAPTTIENWFRAYREGGAEQLVRSAGRGSACGKPYSAAAPWRLSPRRGSLFGNAELLEEAL